MRTVTKRFEVKCPGCDRSRTVNQADWDRRKSDYCQACGNRVRSGLEPCAEESGKGSRLYNIWRGLRQRCGYIAGGHARDLHHYAIRGIDVCEEWRGRFLPFKQWAEANGYEESLLIDRIDNDLGYSPNNCRWVTVVESNRNKRTVLPQADRSAIRAAIKHGTKQCVLAKQYGVTDATITHIKQEGIA